MADAVPYGGPERRITIPADEVVKLTAEVARLVATNTSLSGALDKVSEISERQVALEESAREDREAVKSRWHRDNRVFGVVVLVLVGFGILFYRQHNFSQQNATQIQQQEQQRLSSLQTTFSNCQSANLAYLDQSQFLDSIKPIAGPMVGGQIDAYLMKLPAPQDCSTYPPQIAALQKQLGHA